MARYIDIDKLIAEYDRVHIGLAGGARKLMVEAPTADVVPRAMIADIFSELESEITAALESNYKAKAMDTADDFVAYCEGKIHALRGILDFIEELKKNTRRANNEN